MNAICDPPEAQSPAPNAPILAAQNLAVFLDVESTGIWLGIDKNPDGSPMKEPNGKPIWVRSADPRQPHIVQPAASLVDMTTREVVDTLEFIVRPDGWEIPADVVAIHGITTERALAEGIDARDGLERFLAFWRRSQRPRIAFNEAFDARLVRIGLARHGFPEDVQLEWNEAASECAMLLATPIVKAPAKNGKKGYKWPSLKEACDHFGIPQPEAHDAAVDVARTIDVYWAIQDIGHAPPAPPVSGDAPMPLY
jgi:DNA polymerase-3 subunit epsilon